MLKRNPARPVSSAAGFSLVELMIALVVGLIVVGAVLALILSMIRANNQTIQSTRLTQELRATASVIASDIKRARGVADPLAAAKAGNNFATFFPADGATDVCARYGYEGASGGGYHAIHLNNSKVVMVAANTYAGATCAAAGQQLSSAQVNVTALSFTVTGRQISVTLTGTLVSTNPDVQGITRTLTQTVFVRSVGS